MTQGRRSPADRIYAWLLALFPREFRGDFGEQMTDDFCDQRRDATDRRARATLWTRTTASMMRQAPIEHVELLWRDITYAVRVLRRSPAFTSVAIATLALGIGINGAVFSVADSLLFRPLPFRDPDRLIMIKNQSPTGSLAMSVNRAIFDSIEAHHTGIEDAAVTTVGPNLTWRGTADSLSSVEATPNLLELLGGSPHLGRYLGRSDDAVVPRAAMLSFDLWSARFGSDPSVIGRTIPFEETTVQIVGVLPRDFIIPVWGAAAKRSVLLAKSLNPADATNPRANVLGPIARLKPGVTIEQAQNEMDVLVGQAARQLPPASRGRPRAAGLQQSIFERNRPFLWMLAGAAALVLLIACVNLATLLIARSTGREQEVGIRVAIGASRGRIARQLITESVVLTSAAGIAAIIMCTLTVDALERYIPAGYQIASDGFTTRALLFILTISAIAAVLFGAWPAARLAASDPNATMRDTRLARGSASGIVRGGKALVTVQVALATILLVATGLMVNSLIRMRTVDLGFDVNDGAVMKVTLPQSKYRTPAECHAYYQELLHRIGQLPGVRAVGATYYLQVNGEAGVFGFKGGPRDTAGWLVTPGYLEAMAVPLVEGRTFNASDLRGDSDAVIFDEAVARHLWPEGSALGRSLSLDDGTNVTVVGVVRSFRDGYGRAARPAIYRPKVHFSRATTIIARASDNPSALVDAMQSAARQLEPGALVSKPQSLQAALREGIATTEFDTWLYVVFGAVGLAVAAIGIYGLMAYWVGARTREMGVRISLGATSTQVHALVAKQSAVPLVAGLALGMVGAFALVRQLESRLYGITPYDVPTFVGVALLLFAVGMTASYLPARRAARIDPVIALRSD